MAITSTSPRPWRVEESQYTGSCTDWPILDANGSIVAQFVSENDASLIVDAVNAFDRVTAKEKAVNEEINDLRLENNRMRHMLKKLADMYMDHTVWRLSRDEQALIDEARNAIGEEAADAE